MRYPQPLEDYLVGNPDPAPVAPAPGVAPGKLSTTSRLAPRAQQIVFRVESPQAVAALADRFGPRDANGVAENAGAAVETASSSGGAPLPAGVRDSFEQSLGADLSAVRVHTGDPSAAAAAAVGARAFTTGNDIHFGAGQYAPDDPFGLHLLAHEVAHTQQQSGGPATRQYKLEVSAPQDAAEIEADRAADAMVVGAPVTGLAGVARGAMRSPTVPTAKPSGFTIATKIPLGKAKVSFLDTEGEAALSLELKPKDGGETSGGTDDKKPGGSSIEVKGEVATSKDGNSAKVAAEKELPEGWGFKPKLAGEAELGKDGIKGKLGFSAEREGFKLGDWELGTNEFSFDLVSWDKKDGAKFATLGWKCGAKIKSGKWKNYDITGSITVELKLSPNKEEVAKFIAQRMAQLSASALAGAAGAAALPIAVFLGGLVAWSKAGHEFDEVSRRIENTAATCRAAAAEALSGKHEAKMFGGMDLAGHVGSLAKDIREKVAAELSVPPALLAEVAKAKPQLPNMIYAAAWKQKWPPLKAALLEQWKDTFLTSYKFERQWLESFETGSFAPKSS